MKNLDLSELLGYLLAHSRPVSEPELLRRFLPESAQAMVGGVTMELYRAHFTLYHHLYRLASALAGTRYFIHINVITIHLFERPPPGSCRYFDRDRIGFCGAPAPGGEYCEPHSRLLDRLRAEGAVDRTDIRSFYLDESNYGSMDEKTLLHFARSVLMYAVRYREIEHCLEVLGLPLDYSLSRLRNRYRYLSLRYHPDLGVDGPYPFSEITCAYHILRELKS